MINRVNLDKVYYCTKNEETCFFVLTKIEALSKTASFLVLKFLITFHRHFSYSENDYTIPIHKLNNDFAHINKKDRSSIMNNNPPATPQNNSEENSRDIKLQTLRVIGLIVLISGYILVALSEVGELKTLLTNPNANPDLAEVDPF